MEKIDNIEKSCGEYVVVKAKSGGVQVIGLTRGGETRTHHTEMLDKGEVLIAQFTEKTSAIKIKGDAEVFTKYGTVESFRAEK